MDRGSFIDTCCIFDKFIIITYDTEIDELFLASKTIFKKTNLQISNFVLFEIYILKRIVNTYI